MGEIIKERNYRYDALRGICMFLIVLQHFTFKGGYPPSAYFPDISA